MAANGEQRARRRWSMVIGRVLGIEIRVHVSFLLIVLVVGLAASTPEGPGLASGMLWIIGVFGSVVVHELAHSVVARKRGADVREILLLPIGGVSRLEHLPEDPRDELAIAIVGPAASVALAVVVALVAIAAGIPLVPVRLFDGPLVARLAWVNLVLAGFNLLPAFPMDGGRVFRSILERRYDLETATRKAARLGRAVAILMAALGVFVDVWFLIIGVFVYFGASAEEAATIIHVRLRGLRVRDVMLRQPVTVAANGCVGDVDDIRRHTAQRVFPVVDADRYLGLLSVVDLGHAQADTMVSTLARRDVPTLGAEDLVEEDALPALTASPIRTVAVVDGEGHVVGLLGEADVVDAVEHRGAMRHPPDSSREA